MIRNPDSKTVPERKAKDPTSYHPDRPGPHDQPASRGPGDVVTPPGEVSAQQEKALAAIETGHLAPDALPPDDVFLPSREEAAPERPPNPAWPKERRP